MEGGGGRLGPAVPLRVARGQHGGRNHWTTEGEWMTEQEGGAGKKTEQQKKKVMR